MVCTEGFNFGPLSAPRAEKRDADLRGIWVPGALSAEMPSTCAEKVLLAS